MSKTKLFNLLTLGAISLGLVACGNEVKHPEQDSQVQEVQEETAEHEEVVETEETLPETEEQEAHDEGQPYTVVEETDKGAIYQYHGSVFDFIKQMQDEVIAAEQGSEDLPLIQLIMGIGMSSACFPEAEYTILDKNGEIIANYKGGEVIEGALAEMEE